MPLSPVLTPSSRASSPLLPLCPFAIACTWCTTIHLGRRSIHSICLLYRSVTRPFIPLPHSGGFPRPPGAGWSRPRITMSQMKLKKFLLRYYPPGIILQYEKDGQMKQKPVDLLDLTPDVDIEVTRWMQYD